MAVNALTLDSRVWPHGWALNGNYADASPCEDLQAAVAGHTLYLCEFHLLCHAAISVEIGSGNAGAALTTLLFGPYLFSATSTIVHIILAQPVAMTLGEAVAIDASGAGLVVFYIRGFIR